MKRISMVLWMAALGVGMTSTSLAATNQFRGVNWADPRDNFQAGVLYISGLSSSDSYDSAFATGTAIMEQFVAKLGANAVRMPINEPTVSQFWSTYTGAIDAVLAKGKVVLCYWDSNKDNKPPDMNAWWNMWKTVVDKYGGNENAYFEVFNEPNMYSKNDLNNLYNDWLTRYSTVPKGRVILDGTGNAQNVSDVGGDSRLKDCLLAVHDYSFFGSESMTKESDWSNHIKGSVGNYAERTVCTEWGGPMSPGTKNGKSYDYLDYSKSPTNYFEGYIRGISNQLRAWNMGSFYWPGLRDGDWYSMTVKTGSGANIVLSIPNKSGLERLQYAWGPVPAGGADGGAGGSAGGRDGGVAGSMADGAAGSAGGRADAAALDGSAGGRSGGGGATGSAGSAGASAGKTSSDGQGGAAGGTTPTSGGSTLVKGGAGAQASSTPGGSGGQSTATAGKPVGGSPTSGGAEANGSSGQSVAGASGQNPSSATGQESGCSCAIGRGPGGNLAVLATLLGFLVLPAARRRSSRAVRRAG